MSGPTRSPRSPRTLLEPRSWMATRSCSSSKARRWRRSRLPAARTPKKHVQQVLRPRAGAGSPGSRKGSVPSRVIPLFPVYLFDVDGTATRFRRRYCGRHPGVLAANGRAAAADFDFLKNSNWPHLATPFGEIFQATILSRSTNSSASTASTIWRGPQDDAGIPRVPEALARGSRPANPPPPPKALPPPARSSSNSACSRISTTCKAPTVFPYKPAPDVILTALAALGARPKTA